MTSATHTFSLDPLLRAAHAGAHQLAPAGSAVFDAVAYASLACYAVFALVALHYALRPWAEKVMAASLSAGALASLLLHGSLRHTPSYVGEGPLWKFVSITQYLPWVVLSVGAAYALYRWVRYLTRHST